MVFTVGSLVGGAAFKQAALLVPVVLSLSAVANAAANPPACARSFGGVMAGVPSSAAFVVPALASLFAGALAAAFFGRRGSPAGRPRAFVRQRLALLPLPSIFTGRLGGERRNAPRQTLQQMPPDTTERIPRTGIRAMIPGSRREWVGRQIRLYTKFCVQKAPARLKPHRGRA